MTELNNEKKQMINNLVSRAKKSGKREVGLEVTLSQLQVLYEGGGTFQMQNRPYIDNCKLHVVLYGNYKFKSLTPDEIDITRW